MVLQRFILEGLSHGTRTTSFSSTLFCRVRLVRQQCEELVVLRVPGSVSKLKLVVNSSSTHDNGSFGVWMMVVGVFRADHFLFSGLNLSAAVRPVCDFQVLRFCSSNRIPTNLEGNVPFLL